ncbi:MAG: S41 family peptidase [Gemmatimonadales bacterium]
MHRLIAILALVPLAGFAEPPASSPPARIQSASATPTCDCAALLDMTIRKVEDTYVAYRLEVTDENRPAYEARKEASRRKALEPGADCLLVIREWIDGFDDPHLFLLENPSFDEAQLDSLARTAVRTEWTETSLRRAFEADPDALDPIEGFWYEESGRYGIVRVEDAPATFHAVVLETSDEGWMPGEVKARFTRTDGGYDVVYRVTDHSTRRYQARLHRGNYLTMPAIGWAKTEPLPPGARPLDPVDPSAPTIEALGDGVVLASIPSHGYGYRARLDSLVTVHADELLAARLLIVDVRGDGGGSSLTTQPLMPFIYAPPERDDVPGPEGDPVILASADNLAYFSRWKSDDTPAWLLDLLARIGQHYGEVIPFQDPPDTTRSWVPGTWHETPARVAVLQDGGSGSAAEAFILFALHSRRVTTFGAPTRGMIDYQNVGIVRVGCPDAGLLLGYPTIAASAELPEGGLNATGILPDVEMGVDGDMVGRVVEYYEGDPSP